MHELLRFFVADASQRAAVLGTLVGAHGQPLVHGREHARYLLLLELYMAELPADVLAEAPRHAHATELLSGAARDPPAPAVRCGRWWRCLRARFQGQEVIRMPRCAATPSARWAGCALGWLRAGTAAPAAGVRHRRLPHLHHIPVRSTPLRPHPHTPLVAAAH